MASFLESLVKASPKVFVWVTFSNNHSAYIQISKTALQEYVSSLDDSTDEFFVEILNNGELYLGHPPSEKEMI